MRTKCVYVLTSDGNDYYLEQTFLSVYSLRSHNPDAEIVLVIDKATEKTLIGARGNILKIITAVIAVNCPNKMSKMEKSRYLKTSLRKIVEGDYIFIDGDTVVVDCLDKVDEFQFEIGAVIDKHINISSHTQRTDILKKAELIGWDTQHWDGRYFNSGVMFVKDTQLSYELYLRWHKEWELFSCKGINVDQPSLNKVNEQMNGVITEIGGEWNCQIIENGIRFLNKAHIIHYFASSISKGRNGGYAYLLKNEKIYRQLREEGVSGHIKDIVEHPKEAFADKVRLIEGDLSDFFSSPICKLARKINETYPCINKFIKHFC